MPEPTPKTEVVKCKFTVNNYIEKVWVDGVDMTSNVQGPLKLWTQEKTLSFSDSASVLAVKANDAESGCANGGFAIKCASTNAKSKWNMDSGSDRTKFLVSSALGGYKTPSKDSSGRDWYKKGYSYRTSEFGVPLVGQTTYADSVIKVNDMCGKRSEDSHWHFLFGTGVFVTTTTTTTVSCSVICISSHIFAWSQ